MKAKFKVKKGSEEWRSDTPQLHPDHGCSTETASFDNVDDGLMVSVDGDGL